MLSGGAGDDSFVFDVKAGKKNADTILDFSVGDTIRLDTDVFGKLHGDGVLKAKFFAEGTAARRQRLPHLQGRERQALLRSATATAASTAS